MSCIMPMISAPGRGARTAQHVGDQQVRGGGGAGMPSRPRFASALGALRRSGLIAVEPAGGVGPTDEITKKCRMIQKVDRTNTWPEARCAATNARVPFPALVDASVQVPHLGRVVWEDGGEPRRIGDAVPTAIDEAVARRDQAAAATAAPASASPAASWLGATGSSRKSRSRVPADPAPSVTTLATVAAPLDLRGSTVSTAVDVMRVAAAFDGSAGGGVPRDVTGKRGDKVAGGDASEVTSGDVGRAASGRRTSQTIAGTVGPATVARSSRAISTPSPSLPTIAPPPRARPSAIAMGAVACGERDDNTTQHRPGRSARTGAPWHTRTALPGASTSFPWKSIPERRYSRHEDEDGHAIASGSVSIAIRAVLVVASESGVPMVDRDAVVASDVGAGTAGALLFLGSPSTSREASILRSPPSPLHASALPPPSMTLGSPTAAIRVATLDLAGSINIATPIIPHPLSISDKSTVFAPLGISSLKVATNKESERPQKVTSIRTTMNSVAAAGIARANNDVDFAGKTTVATSAIPAPRLLRPYAAARERVDPVSIAAYSLLRSAVDLACSNGLARGVGVRGDLVGSRNIRTPTASRLLGASSLRSHFLRAINDEGAGVYVDLNGTTNWSA